MNSIKHERKEILATVFPDFLFIENKSEFITWCRNSGPGGCNGKHHKKKLQINVEKNFYHCWVCHDSGHVLKLLSRHSSKAAKEKYLKTLPDIFGDEVLVEDEILELPDEYQFLLDGLTNPRCRQGYKWLKASCNISDDLIFQQKIGFCASGKYKDRLIFPSFDASGNLNYFVTRTVYDAEICKYFDCEGPKKSKIIFNEILIDWESPLILVEGIKSHLRHFEIPNVVPLLGSRLKKTYRLFQESVLNDSPKIYLALDDEAIVEAYDIMESYFSFGMDVRILNLSDVNQPDELTTDEFVDRMVDARPFSAQDKLKTELRKVI